MKALKYMLCGCILPPILIIGVLIGGYFIWLALPKKYHISEYVKDLDMYISIRYEINTDNDSTVVINFGKDKKSMKRNEVILSKGKGLADDFSLYFYVDNSDGNKEIKQVEILSLWNYEIYRNNISYPFYRNRNRTTPDCDWENIKDKIKPDDDFRKDAKNYIIKIGNNGKTLNRYKYVLSDNITMDYALSQINISDEWLPFIVIKQKKLPTRYISLKNIYGEPESDTVFNIHLPEKSKWLDKGWLFLDTLLTESNPNVSIRQTIWGIQNIEGYLSSSSDSGQNDSKECTAISEKEAIRSKPYGIVMYYNELPDSAHVPVDGYHYKYEFYNPGIPY